MQTQLPIEETDDLPPVDSFVCMKRCGPSDEPQSSNDQGTCKIAVYYDDKDDSII